MYKGSEQKEAGVDEADVSAADIARNRLSAEEIVLGVIAALLGLLILLH